MADFNKEFNKMMDTPDSTGDYDTQDIKDNKVYAVLACFGILFFLPLIAAPNSKFGRFWANQGFILLLFAIVVMVISKILSFIPLVGSIVSWLLSMIGLIFFIIALVNAAQGKAKEIPVIGGLINVFNK